MTHTIPYTGNLDWLVPRTVFYVVHGSRAYGTNRPDSDHDYRGIAVPPKAWRDGYLHTFNQAEQKGDPDMVIYALAKFFKLASDCNPNVVELLWVPEDCVLVCTDAGKRLVEHRADFLSRKALYTFRGYAMSQLKRIQTHRRWLLDPPTAPPNRDDFGLPERTVIPKDQLGAAQAAITKKLDSWEIDFGEMDEAGKIYVGEQMRDYLSELTVGSDEKFRAAGRLLGYEANFLDLLEREKRYGAAKRNWSQFKDWQKNRNPARAKMEAEYGYDGKHALHLVRLMRMCREILTEGQVIVRRPDADELKGFLEGTWEFDRLMEWADAQDKELIALAQTSDLPKAPNRVKLDNLCQEVTQMLDWTG